MGERMAAGLPSSCVALRTGSKRTTTSSTRLHLRHPGESREPEELQHRPTRWGRKRKSYNAALPGESRRRSDNAVNPIKADQSSYNVVMPTMKLHHRHPSSPVVNPSPYVNPSTPTSSRLPLRLPGESRDPRLPRRHQKHVSRTRLACRGDALVHVARAIGDFMPRPTPRQCLNVKTFDLRPS